MLDLRRILLIAAVVASLLSIGCSAREVNGGAAEASRGREILDEMKCTCSPCGGPCDYLNPPPPPPSPPPPSPEIYPPPNPYCPPQPQSPPEPWTPPQPWTPGQPWSPPQLWSPPYDWLTPPGKLYPVDPGFISGARRSYAVGRLLQVLLVGCGLLAVWI